jgi:hypothetical protein
LGVEDFATDGTVAIAACLVLLILPNRPPTCRREATTSENGSLSFHSISQDSQHNPGTEIELSGRRQSPNDIEEENDGMDRHEIAVEVQHNAKETQGYQPILPWSVVKNLNWDIIFLLGGGFALSRGFQVSLFFQFFIIIPYSSLYRRNLD